MATIAPLMRRAIGLSLLVVVFFAMRLPSLGLMPLYSDEGLGLWRADRVLEGSLTRGSGEGKPLHAWMIAAAIALPGDDILAARAAHVAAGALLLLALWDLTRRQVSPLAGWIAAALWIVLPYGAIFERTVTPDVPLAAACVAVATCAFRVASPDLPASPESRRWRWLLLFAGAVAMFVKMPIGLLPASLPLLVPFALSVDERAAARARLRTYTRALLATIAVLAAIVAVRAAMGARPLGFGMHEFEKKMAVARDAENAPGAIVENVDRVGEFAWFYFGPIGTVLLLAGLIAAVVKRQRVVLLLAAFALAWVALFVSTARNLSAHYVLEVIPFLVLVMASAVTAGARALQRHGERPIVTASVAAVVVALTLATVLPFHRALWTDPRAARFARTEKLHYIEGRWSGYGLREAAAWIDQAVAAGGGAPLFVAVHLADYERVRLYAAEATRKDLMQVQVERYTLRVPHMIDRVREIQEGGRRVMVVVGSEGRFEARWRSAYPTAIPRFGFDKPGGKTQVVIFELLPPSRGIFGSP
jgi:4-amino-4-deoxy-L-arabinose transferase-like glycosyltransferase